jgi:hypothetical protein
MNTKLTLNLKWKKVQQNLNIVENQIKHTTTEKKVPFTGPYSNVMAYSETENFHGQVLSFLGAFLILCSTY